jgi:hypothetical protein
MKWFRWHQRQLLRLTLGGWLLAMAVVAFQGCLTQAEHAPDAAPPAFSSQSLTADSIQHASGCRTYCADSDQGISAATQLLAFNLGLAMLLLLPGLILLAPSDISMLTARAVWRHATAGPPARIRFVRFNE